VLLCTLKGMQFQQVLDVEVYVRLSRSQITNAYPSTAPTKLCHCRSASKNIIHPRQRLAPPLRARYETAHEYLVGFLEPVHRLTNIAEPHEG